MITQNNKYLITYKIPDVCYVGPQTKQLNIEDFTLTLEAYDYEIVAGVITFFEYVYIKGGGFEKQNIKSFFPGELSQIELIERRRGSKIEVKND